MAYKMKGSGLPFKELGSSPAKQKYDLSKATVTESKSAEFDRKGLVRDEVGPVVEKPKKSWAADFSTWREKKEAEKREKTKKKVDIANKTLNMPAPTKQRDDERKEGLKRMKKGKKKFIGESRAEKKSKIKKVKEQKKEFKEKGINKSWVRGYVKQEKKAARKEHRTTKKAIKGAYKKAKKIIKETGAPIYTGSATGDSA